MITSATATPQSLAASGFAPATPSLRNAVVDLWRTLTKDLLDGYRPEKHYMRGPGPKWRAKHGLPV